MSTAWPSRLKPGFPDPYGSIAFRVACVPHVYHEPYSGGRGCNRTRRVTIAITWCCSALFTCCDCNSRL